MARSRGRAGHDGNRGSDRPRRRDRHRDEGPLLPHASEDLLHDLAIRPVAGSAQEELAAGGCLVVEDATASYFPAFKQAALEMIVAQGGIVGHTATLAALDAAMNEE